jgi:hypothetical protein
MCGSSIWLIHLADCRTAEARDILVGQRLLVFAPFITRFGGFFLFLFRSFSGTVGGRIDFDDVAGNLQARQDAASAFVPRLTSSRFR